MGVSSATLRCVRSVEYTLAEYTACYFVSFVLCCILLCCAVLYCIVLFYVVLVCAVQKYVFLGSTNTFYDLSKSQWLTNASSAIPVGHEVIVAYARIAATFVHTPAVRTHPCY